MSNIEGEKLMAQGAASVDADIVRGPKGQAADLLAELDFLQAEIAKYLAVRNTTGGVLAPSDAGRLTKMIMELDNKRVQALRFLLEQFSNDRQS